MAPAPDRDPDGGTPEEPLFSKRESSASVLAAARADGPRWRRLCLSGSGAGADGLSYADVEQVVQACPGLSHLSLAFFRPSAGDEALAAALRVPGLVHLNLSDTRLSGDALRSLLESCAPTLQRLYLCGTWVQDVDEGEALTQWLDDEDGSQEDRACPCSPLASLEGLSFPALTSLDLSYCLVGRAPLLRALAAAPALRELFLVGALREERDGELLERVADDFGEAAKAYPDLAWGGGAGESAAAVAEVEAARPGLELVSKLLKSAGDGDPSPGPELLALLPAVLRAAGPDVPLASGGTLFLHALSQRSLSAARALVSKLGCDPLAPAFPSWLRGRRQPPPWTAPYPMRPELIDGAAGLKELHLPGQYPSNRVCDQDPEGAHALHVLASRLFYDRCCDFAQAQTLIGDLGLARLAGRGPAPGPGGLSPLTCALHALAPEPDLVQARPAAAYPPPAQFPSSGRAAAQERMPYLLSLGLPLDPPDNMLEYTLARGQAHLTPTVLRALAHDPAALARALRFRDAAGNTVLALAVHRMRDRRGESPELGYTWLNVARALLEAGAPLEGAPALLRRACAERPELRDDLVALFAQHGVTAE
eukprot:tig00021312_g20066.t1